MKENELRYIYYISLGLALNVDDDQVYSVGEYPDSLCKIKRLGVGSYCIKLWGLYQGEWTFLGQFDLYDRVWHESREFESEDEWI